MRDRQTHYRGCLLGLAVGDAMGYTVDGRSLEQIRRDYGPNGLLGYDLVNGYADVTSFTQLAAFTCNGLLLALTQGQLFGRMAPYVRYIRLSSREWAQGQSHSSSYGRTFCWVGQVRELRARRCMDNRMLDALLRDTLGSMEEPSNRFTAPGAITVAIPVGLFFNPQRSQAPESDRLGAEAVALTHGNPLAFLTGGALAHLISHVVWDGVTDLPELISDMLDALDLHFGREYPQVHDISNMIQRAVNLAGDPDVPQCSAMERLRCDSAPEVLAGALYACLTCHGDFDTAMITAINHSGRSAAVGAVTGGILGAIQGYGALPDFYLDSLEPADTLLELADDMYQGCPMDRSSRLFDDAWDQKYIHFRGQ